MAVRTSGWGSIPVTLRGKGVREVFTEGYCGALAKALNHITGCQIIKTDIHAAIITFDGRVLDIEGVHSPTKFECKWGWARPCDENDLIDYGADQWRRAAPFAKLLARKYLH